MTDEQLGRAWCERHGKRPVYVLAGEPDGPVASRHAGWWWAVEGAVRTDPAHQLRWCLYDELESDRHPTEADAYAAVGAAIRRVLAFADGVRGILS